MFDALTAAPWLASLYGQHQINVEDRQQKGRDLLYPFHTSLISLPQLHVKSSEKIRKREVEFHIRKASGLNEDRLSYMHCPYEEGITHFKPTHCLGPLENGTNHFSNSLPFSPSQRSGTNLSGDRKILVFWWIESRVVRITV